MKSIFRIIFIHLTIYLDHLGNWLFNIYLFNQISSLDHKFALIAVFFTFIRFSNFFSLFLGGRFIEKPKKLFLFSVATRVITLILVFLLIQETSLTNSIYYLLIGLVFKNVLSGVDLSIYNHYFKTHFDNKPVHYKIKQFITSFSLISSYPVYLFLKKIDPHSPVLFDILSYCLLLIVVLFSSFPSQNISKNLILKANDIFRSLYSSSGIKEILSSLFILNLVNTIPFNYSYNYFLEEANLGGVEVLYGILGVGFFVGNLIAKRFNYNFSKAQTFIFYLFSIVFIKYMPLNVWQTMLIFGVINVFYAYNLFKFSVSYFPSLKPQHTNILSNLYSITFLVSSIIGSWLVAYDGINSLIVLFTLSFLSIGLLSFGIKLLIFFQEKRILKENGIELKSYFFKSPSKEPYILIYSDKKGINASFIERSGYTFFFNFFNSHNKVFSEVIERILSKQAFLDDKHKPLSNGCACHISPSQSHTAARLEILERDSIILSYMYELPSLYKLQINKIDFKINAQLFFFLTADPEVIACLLYGKGILGYSTISTNEFKNQEFKGAINKAIEEYYVTYSTHINDKNTPPPLPNEVNYQDYYKKYKNEYSPSSLLNSILTQTDQLFSFLTKTSILSKSEEFNESTWNNHYFFNEIDFDIVTEYHEEYGRYFSHAKVRNFAYPIWPDYSQDSLLHLQSRLKSDLTTSVIMKNKPCPII